MKKEEKTSQFASLAEQNLPGPDGESVKQAQAPAADLASVPPSSTVSEGTRLGAVERTHDLIVSHASRLHGSGSGVIRVLIEPGAGLQLLLELRASSQGIEAQVLMREGDFAFFNRHWSRLQHRLKARDIHLGSLLSREQRATPDQDSPRPGSSDQTDPNNSTDFVFGGSMTESPPGRRGRAKSHRGWEKWA